MFNLAVWFSKLFKPERLDNMAKLEQRMLADYLPWRTQFLRDFARCDDVLTDSPTEFADTEPTPIVVRVNACRPFKPFFVHCQLPVRHRRQFGGFTAYISPTEDGRVSIQHSLCSSKDVFSRAIGRRVAMEHPANIVAAKHVSIELAKLYAIVWKLPKNIYRTRQFDYVYKYMV